MNLNQNLSYSLKYVTLCKFLAVLITLLEDGGENARKIVIKVNEVMLKTKKDPKRYSINSRYY